MSLSPRTSPPSYRSKLEGLDGAALQAQMAAGTTSALALTRYCLKRIEAVDANGPCLRSVIEVNPDALAQARALDSERQAAKVRGPMHGLTVLLKDNIATADRMATTAGSLALAGLQAQCDAHIVTRLRAAGAVILGKTNLSEWANFRSTRSSSGWSSRGGQTRNPYDLTRSPSGSSSGSAVAVAAGLCVFAVGTETDGSIISPASRNGLVGFKPTLGRVSRDGIIPIAASQDTAGPMARSVRDAALLMACLAGPDRKDSATQDAPEGKVNYPSALKGKALNGQRIGVVRQHLPNHPPTVALFENALAVLRAQGAVLIEDLEVPHRDKYAQTELVVLLHEFKAGIAHYLRTIQPDAPAQDLQGLIDWNLAHADVAMPIFDQELFLMAQQTKGLTSATYLKALARNRRYARDEGLDALFSQHHLDALVTPSGNPAWRVDHVLGDFSQRAGFTGPFAVAGYPHITVPMGLAAGLPVGLSMGALPWQDAKLLGMAHAFEQASHMRQAPTFSEVDLAH
ncbi:MAG: amidase [Betaproteobacteria bacterium]